MKRSKSVPVTLVSGVAAMAMAAGCGSPQPGMPTPTSTSTPTHQTLCGDQNGRVVAPENCDQEARRTGGHVPAFLWFYAPFGRTYPVGSTLTDATRTLPAGAGVRVAPPVRGGFGTTGSPSAAA